MNHANLFAYLLGVLSVEPQRNAIHPHDSIGSLVRDLWHTAAGTARSSDLNGSTTLPILDHNGVARLCSVVSERFSDEAAEMIDWYRRHKLSRYVETDLAQYHEPIAQPDLADLYQGLLALTMTELQTLNDKPEETACSTLHALWHTAAGIPMSVVYAREIPLPELDDGEISTLRELLTQRFTGIPLAHLTGRQQFMGLELNVGRAALIPRKETEILGFAALAVLRQVVREQSEIRVIDVCTGVGNLALGLAFHEPKAQVYASDLSIDAIELAQMNRLQLGLDGQITFRQGDFLGPFANDGFDRNVDLLVCNPPYISSGRVGTLPAEIIGHEPRLAFDGGPFGVKILQRLISEAPRFLRSGGWLAFEVGKGQGTAIMERLWHSQSFTDLCEVEDAAGTIRAVLARV